MALAIPEEHVDKARRAYQWYQHHRRWFQLGERALRTIYYARTGGPISIAAACFTMGASVADAVFPEVSLDEALRRRGYHPTSTAISRLLCALLERNETPTLEIERGSATAKIWEHDGRGAAFISHGDRHPEGPYVLAGDESLLLEAVSRGVWTSGNDLMLTSKTQGLGFDLVPIPDPGPYVGKPTPEFFAERLARYKGRPRTLLIKGPTGVGKSVLARRVAALASHGTARTLKVSSVVLHSFGSAQLRDLARYVQPSVLLLDDLQIGRGGSGPRRVYYADDDERSPLGPLLDVLEALRVEGCLVVITMMTPVSKDGDVFRGDHYVQGMRPGRIDEIVTLAPPDKVQRSLILKHYYGLYGVKLDAKTHASLVRKTDGLTGAYLRELAQRIAVHGESSLRAEVISVLLSAPPEESGPPGRRRATRRKRAALIRRKRPSPTAVALRARAASAENKAKAVPVRAEKHRLDLLEKARKLRERADAKEKRAAEAKAKKAAKPKKAAAKKKPKAKAKAKRRPADDQRA